MKNKKAQNTDQFVEQLPQWQVEVEALRKILLKTKVVEAFKWRLPCYCVGEQNIAIIQPFKKTLGLMFFKGALIKDIKNILVANGPNSHSSKRLEFTSLDQIKKLEPIIKAYMKEAIEVELAGLTVTPVKKSTPVPRELQEKFEKSAKFKRAFAALTPGRQRAYLLYFSSAKQESTRNSRIQKYEAKIIAGKGIND